MLGNIYFYRSQANRDETLEKYATNLPYERLDWVLLRRETLGFSLTGILLMLITEFGLGLVTPFALAVVYLLSNAAMHTTFGFKDIQNDPTNLRLLTLITFW